jgi:ABC-type sugar transport system substrate-binding protein
MSALDDILKENGAEYTIVACDDNSSQQVGQIENFISSKCDLIMVHPSDANAVEDVCKEAKDAGIKVMCWDDPMTNTDGNWILNNTDLGIAIGELAGDFIAEHYTDSKKAEVALIDYPQTKVLKERGDGIQQGLKNKADGKYEIVAEQPAIEANKAQTAMETILQANPDCKVVAGVGAGAMIGANEALVTATGGKIPEDMGVFTTDVTKDQLKQLLDKKAASKGIIGFEGSDVDTATACASMYALILGGKLDQQNVFRQVGPITEENAQEIMDEMK